MKWAVFSKLVMIEQSLFGLPWVITGSVLPYAMSTTSLRAYGNVSLWIAILVAFFAARSAGMSFNRLIDRHIDALNPRTKSRVLPMGVTTPIKVMAVAWISVALFILACAAINTTCLILSPVAVLLLWLYSYTKRFTYFCHFILGCVHFLVPIFAWAAITDSLAWPPVLLGSVALASISGNDILYATQDYSFDKQHGLYSIPARFSLKTSIFIGKSMHFVALLLLVALGLTLTLNWIFYVGVAVIAAIYFYYHRLINVNALGNANRILFACNTSVAMACMIFTVGSILWLA